MTRASFSAVAAVPVENLLLDLSNARIRTGADQADCIARILRKEAQFMALATDIAESGLSTAPVLVESKGRNSFVVWDGNRRVTALKLLNNPKLCTVTLVRKKLEVLAAKHAKTIPSRIDVLASSDTKALMAEVLKRHSGELGGVGQVNWSAFLRTVFLTSHHVSDPNRRAALLFLWAEEHGVEVPDEIKITSLTRFLKTENLKALGFEIAGDQVKPIIAIDKAIAVTQRLAADFSPGGSVGVDEVFKPEQALSYVHDVLRSVGLSDNAAGSKPRGSGERAHDGGRQSDQGGSREGRDGEDASGDDSDEEDSKPKRKPSRPTKESWDRNKLLSRKGGPSFEVPAAEKKTNNIVVELGKLNPYEAPIAVAALFRMLLEFSEEFYRTKNRNIGRGSNKPGDIARVADHMLERDRIDEADHALVKRYVKQGAGGLLHHDTLNAYMHSPKAHPSGQNLCIMWDELEPFVQACWA